MHFDAITEHFKINIRVFESFNRNGKRAWQLLVGRDGVNEKRPTLDIGYYKNLEKKMAHCYYIKDLNVLIETWECQKCYQRFNKKDNLQRHQQNGSCNGGQTKVICRGSEVTEILSKWKQVFYESRVNFSKKACAWI